MRRRKLEVPDLAAPLDMLRQLHVLLSSGATDPATAAITILAPAIDLLEMIATGKKKVPKAMATPKGDFSEVLRHYFCVYEKYCGVAPVMSARTGKAAKDMLKCMSVEDIKGVIDVAFEDDFFRDKIRELYYIAMNANKYRRASAPVTAAPAEMPDTLSPFDVGEPVIDEELSKRLGL